MQNTLGFQLYSIKDYEGGWDAGFEAIRALGIDTIEAWCGAVPANPNASTSLEELRGALERADMKLTCGHLTVAEFDGRYADWSTLLRDFGSTDWVVPFAKGANLDEWLGFLPKFREMAERLKADGFRLGYHNHHQELEKIGDKYVMEHLLDNMPELQAQFHIGQFLPDRGIYLPGWIEKYAGRICSIHVNDATSDGVARLGQGDCHAKESIKAALKAGVTTYIIEIPLTKVTIDGVQRDVEFARNLIS